MWLRSNESVLGPCLSFCQTQDRFCCLLRFPSFQPPSFGFKCFLDGCLGDSVPLKERQGNLVRNADTARIDKPVLLQVLLVAFLHVLVGKHCFVSVSPIDGEETYDHRLCEANGIDVLPCRFQALLSVSFHC